MCKFGDLNVKEQLGNRIWRSECCDEVSANVMLVLKAVAFKVLKKLA